MSLDIFYSCDTAFTGDISLRQYKYDSETDSILVYSRNITGYSFLQGVHQAKTRFNKKDTGVYYERKYFEILKRVGSIPPGSYKTYISVKNENKIINSCYIHEVDSSLDHNSAIRKDINKSITPKSKKSFLRKKAEKVSGSIKTPEAGVAFRRAGKKVDAAAKKRGLTSVKHQRDGVSYADLYYEEWFAGRYEVKDKATIESQTKKLEDKADAMTGNTSLFSQNKILNKQKKDADEMTGSVSFSGNMGSAQDPYSGVDNNYFEVRGETEVPVMGIPVQLEGLYTSQDANRTIKSSYFRVHYDVKKLKDNLFRSLNSYNSQYAMANSKAEGTNKLYKTAVTKLEAQKDNLLNDLDEQERDDLAKKMKNDITDTTGMVSDAANSTDPKVAKRRKKLENAHKKVVEIDKKIAKLNTLQKQYNNTKYFDSSLGFARTKDMDDYSDMSYKQMAKKGINVLPDGKAKQFLSGVTTVDAGMFAKNDSRFTMAGQMMKGASMGYDLGFCETSVTVGKTQFIGRNGQPDKYTCYSSKTTFKAAKGHKIGITYYGYSADRSLYSRDVFFEKIDVAAPSFFDPVHIVSADYTGKVSKYVTLESEVASSFRNSDKTAVPKMASAERMAYHFSGEGSIPETYVNIGVGYEKTGKGFENQTLPLAMSGTEQYKITASNQFFRSLLSVAVDYNRITQNNLASSATNTKWGFDVKTGFKKYPNVSVSYKPFTTFHAHTDTMTIPQRPMLGSVWTCKASYNVKGNNGSWRFVTMYNSCMTDMDTTRYGNTTVQASCFHSIKKLTNTLTVGYMQMTGTNAPAAGTAQGKTDFINLNSTCAVSKTLSISAGEEIGLAAFGTCRNAVNAGVVVKFPKAPYIVRVGTRYTRYKLTEADAWTSMYNGSIDITYRFRSRIRQ